MRTEATSAGLFCTTFTPASWRLSKRLKPIALTREQPSLGELRAQLTVVGAAPLAASRRQFAEGLGRLVGIEAPSATSVRVMEWPLS